MLAPLLSYSLRPFRPTDAVAVSQIICRCLREVNTRDYSWDEMEKMIPAFTPQRIAEALNPETSIVAVKAGKVVATGTAVNDYIKTVFVDPDLHGRGIGRSIMQRLEQLVRSNGFQSARLNSSVTALEFYHSLGYEVRSETYQEVGAKSILMEKIF